jgi:hypothetical protein
VVVAAVSVLVLDIQVALVVMAVLASF